MDLDYIQRYEFAGEQYGGLPLRNLFQNSDSALQTGGGNPFLHLAIPGGLVYNPDHNYESACIQEEDPAEIGVKEDFDSLLDLVTFAKPAKNITVKHKSVKPGKRTRTALKN
jgi:hypothetical protein